METKIVELHVNTNIEDAEKQLKQLDKSLNKVEDSSNNVSGAMKESSLSVLENGGAMGLLNDATGGLAMTVKDAVEATALFAKQSKISTSIQAAYATVVGASTGAMKVFRLALVATGIGAIVIAVGLLIANFDKVKKAVLNLVPGLSVIGDIFTTLVETVTDFVGITSEASRELGKLGKQADATLKKNKFALEAYGDTYDQYTKRKIEANNKYAQQVKDINEDETLSESEKLKKLKILRETANREIDKSDSDRQAEKNKKAKEEQNKINEVNKEASDKKKAILKLEQEEIKKLEKEKQALKGRQGEQARQQYEDNEKLIADAKKRNLDAGKTENQLKVEAEILDFETKKQRLVSSSLSFEEIEIEHKRKLAELNNQYYAGEADKSAKSTADAKAESDKRIEIAKAEAQQKQDIQNAQFALASGAVNFLKEIAGKNKAIQKAAIIAENAIGIGKMIIANNAANIGALATPQAILTSGASAIPVIAMNNITTALGVATTIASTAKALSAVGGGSAGSALSSGGGGGSSAPAAPNFNVVGTSGQNQIAQTLNREQPPVKAYVVAGEMTTQQSLDRNIVNSASVG